MESRWISGALLLVTNKRAAEADFIEKHLQVSHGAKLLDVPCGNGRLAIELARRGYQLTGIDIAEGVH